MNLFLDTETTGVFNFKAPIDNPAQPRIVQLGAILVDPEERVVGEINLLVRPDGWTIPPEAAAVHGITQEKAELYGLPIAQVMRIFMGFVFRSKLLVAHSFSFDSNMLQRELFLLGLKNSADAFKAIPSFCTMQSTTDVLKIPGPYGYKWPKLMEAYKFFFSEEFQGAHDAMADVRACQRIYYHCIKTPRPPAS